MIYSIRDSALALGFFSISIFPAYFSFVLRYYQLGGNSIRSGLIVSISIFFILAVPFGIRYFVTPKIILINISVFFLILVSYLCSTLLFSEVDDVRFLLSLALLFSISFASISFVTTLDVLKDEFFHKMILFGFYFLMFLGYIIFIRRIFLGYTDHSTLSSLSFIFFSETSHYALTFFPFLFYAVYTSSKNIYSVLYIIGSIFLALTIQNVTLLVGCLLVCFITYGGRRFWLLGLAISILVFTIIYLDVSYFLERLDFTEASSLLNPTMLVFLSGWERAYLSFFDSFGVGVGFQQIGIVGPEGNFQIMLQNLHHQEKGLNWNDGGTLGSKLIVEFGFLGLMLLLLYCFFAINILIKFWLQKIKGFKNIFFFGVYLVFSIELFIRGMGYFSLTSFMFISSMYWIYRSQILTRQQ
jgi:hypothetical protein